MSSKKTMPSQLTTSISSKKRNHLILDWYISTDPTKHPPFFTQLAILWNAIDSNVCDEDMCWTFWWSTKILMESIFRRTIGFAYVQNHHQHHHHEHPTIIQDVTLGPSSFILHDKATSKKNIHSTKHASPKRKNCFLINISTNPTKYPPFFTQLAILWYKNVSNVWWVCWTTIIYSARTILCNKIDSNVWL